MDALVGANEDDNVVEVLLHVDSSGQHGAVAELDFDGIVEQVGVQRLFHQLHRVPGRGPVEHRVQGVRKQASKQAKYQAADFVDTSMLQTDQ